MFGTIDIVNIIALNVEDILKIYHESIFSLTSE